MYFLVIERKKTLYYTKKEESRPNLTEFYFFYTFLILCYLTLENTTSNFLTFQVTFSYFSLDGYSFFCLAYY